MTSDDQNGRSREQEARALEAGLSLPTIDSVREGCYSDAQLAALIHDQQRRAGEIPETITVDEVLEALAHGDQPNSTRQMACFVADDHIWPAGWTEAKFYLPLDCPSCGRSRLLYALSTEKPSEGLLVHCEKCHAASYDEVEMGVERL